jgi:hypothetical protein
VFHCVKLMFVVVGNNILVRVQTWTKLWATMSAFLAGT